MKAFAQNFFETWDRETTLTFVSLVVASYAWIVAEELFLGIAMGIAMHAIQVVAYEFLAARFGWTNLDIADFARTHALPRIMHFVSKTQRA
ncbi:MAG: hypothetical protein A2854_04940 [Parcubacteria group bacterium RIFCSPHIGHO2_01_FULL_56_18]|nr:MAG: hypothetical protein A2854_04940 [Parcubacteria group bacterium RIFCSPHIGHO2_01_FULL_56_18]